MVCPRVGDFEELGGVEGGEDWGEGRPLQHAIGDVELGGCMLSHFKPGLSSREE